MVPDGGFQSQTAVTSFTNGLLTIGHKTYISMEGTFGKGLLSWQDGHVVCAIASCAVLASQVGPLHTLSHCLLASGGCLYLF
jgi:hypothetical protein